MTDRDTPAEATGEAFEFFDRLSIILAITLSEPAVPISPNLLNVKAPPDATIEAVSSKVGVFEDNDLRDITDDELDRIVLIQPSLRLRGIAGVEVEHRAPDGARFRVRGMVRCIEETARQTRGSSEWFDGVDVHHIFFEGIERLEDASYRTNWGS